MESEVFEILKIAAPLLIAAGIWYPAFIYTCLRSEVPKRRYKGKATTTRYTYRKEENVLYRRRKMLGRSRR